MSFNRPHHDTKFPDSWFGPDNATGHAIGRFYRQPNGTIGFAADAFILWGDAMNAIERSVSPETAKTKGLVRTAAYEEESRPDAVDFAFAFVQHCNQATEPVGHYTRSYDGATQLEKVTIPELPVKQEAALGMACQLIGQYFADALGDLDDGIEPEHEDGEDDHGEGCQQPTG